MFVRSSFRQLIRCRGNRKSVRRHIILLPNSYFDLERRQTQQQQNKMKNIQKTKINYDLYTYITYTVLLLLLLRCLWKLLSIYVIGNDVLVYVFYLSIFVLVVVKEKWERKTNERRKKNDWKKYYKTNKSTTWLIKKLSNITKPINRKKDYNRNTMFFIFSTNYTYAIQCSSILFGCSNCFQILFCRL